MFSTFSGPATSSERSRARRLGGRRALAATTAAVLLVGVAGTSIAATKVTVTNPGGLTAVGPVNTEYGFPSYYQDKAGTRVEPCLDAENALCGFLPGDVPNPEAPISFPDNFPGEFFYQLVDSSLTLPGGGRATLTLGLEAAFANEEPIAGDQQTFARTRVVVVGGPRNTTLTFKHPFGEVTVDTDAAGKGRLVQDIAPAAGNFTTALKSNFGPFLKWDPAVAPAAPAGFLGDPGQQHTVVGGLNGYNKFTALGSDGAQLATTDQFGISGKVATNTGVKGDYAVVNGAFLDVFASTTGTQIQVDGVEGAYATTPMTHDADSDRHYARIALLNGAKPTSVTVRNLADKPVATATIKVTDVKVEEATYDGVALHLKVSATAYPVTVAGVGTVTSGDRTDFAMVAPPAVVTVSSASGGSVTVPVLVTAGDASPQALPPVTPAQDPGPVNDNTPNNTTPTPAPAPAAPVVSVAAPAATLPGGSVTLDASATTGATSYLWKPVSAPAGTKLTNETTAKPTVTLPFFTTIGATDPAAAWPTVTYTVEATNATGTSTKTVTVPVKTDALTATGRHKVGTELRIDGTSLVDGAALAGTPQTQVVLWKVTTAANGTVTYTKLGTSPVDTLGAYALRQKPGPTAQVSTVLVQSTRGGTTTAALTTR